MDAKLNPDLNDVALLVRVVQIGSFSAAARERGVPASTVSRHIARLEHALGTRLLERTTRSLRLTDAGRNYFAHAERGVDDIAQGTDHVRELQTEPRGRVRIMAPLIFSGAITKSLYAYLAKHPGVAVDLELGQRSVDLLGEGFDIAILSHKIDSTDFVARELRTLTRKVLLASPSYLAARGVPRRIEDLAHHDCIAMPVAGAAAASDGTVTWTLARGGDKRRITLKPRFTVNEPSAARNAVLAGLGIGLFPETRGADAVASERLHRVLASYSGETGGLYLLYRAHRSLTAAIRTCIDHFVADLGRVVNT
jgi:DNA-binding transcriptional LysR family regulator